MTLVPGGAFIMGKSDDDASIQTPNKNSNREVILYG
jgi:hypothetical protein